LDNYKLPKRDARFGRCIVIIQTTGKTGNIILEAKSPGLPEASVNLTSE
jgi:hypothetical protein